MDDAMRGGFAKYLINMALCLVLVMTCAVSSTVTPSGTINNGNIVTQAPLTIMPSGTINNGNTATQAPLTITPSGTISNGNTVIQAPLAINLWVDAVNGNDGNDGSTPAAAFHSIQKAADIAGSGTIVHILPGIYRETVQPAHGGGATKPIVYRAENGPGTAIIRGSERADTLAWSQLTGNSIGLPSGVDPKNLYYADLSAWALDDTPRFVVQLDGSGETVVRLPLAREPDWQVSTEWKYHEFWWAADGGSTTAACDPASDPDPDCDYSSRSTTQLTDRHNDNEPAGIESGNLTTLGNLIGATLVAMDTNSAHYVYRRKIVSHSVSAGRITVDQPCEFDQGSVAPGLGWGSKYFIENDPALLDTPGEWWYDASNSRLYLWPLASGSPATQNIEISRRDTGFGIYNHSYITLDGLAIEFFNDNAFHQSQSCPGCGAYNNTVRNVTLRYANVGIELGQGTDHLPNVTDGFTLEDSEIGHMDTMAIHSNFWWSGGTADSFTHVGIRNTVIRNNELYDLGFRTDSDNADGIQFNYAHRLRFEGNYVHHVAHNGMVLSRSVIQSTKEYGFSPSEIKTGIILIKDNIFEKACLMAADCGGLKISGGVPDNHVFRDMLITGNTFRDAFGWSYISEKRERWSGGTSSDVQGMGGFGLYVDWASGVHAYRNIAYNNASSGFHLYNRWWDGEIVYYNNIAANSLHGIRLDAWAPRGSINTQIANNILVNNEGYGILMYHSDDVDYGNFLLDHNLYHNNGWRGYEAGGVWEAGDLAIYGPDEYYQTLAAIQAHTPWEDHGVEGIPGFWDYNSTDHNLFDGSWPDFHTTSASTGVLDQGTTSLPGSLARLLTLFGVQDAQMGDAYDIGRYEAAGVISNPMSQMIQPGDTATFILSSYPSSFPGSLALITNCPEPDLLCSLSSASLGPGQTVTLTVVDTHDPESQLGLPALYVITVSAVYGGGTHNTFIHLSVGWEYLYLPLTIYS